MKSHRYRDGQAGATGPACPATPTQSRSPLTALLMAIGMMLGTVEIIDAATGQSLRILAGHDSAVTAVAFSPDGTLLATASDDATARIWDATTGAHLVTLVPLPEGAMRHSFRMAATSCPATPPARLWWAIKLCRFEPGELDPYVPGISRLAPDATVLPPSSARPSRSSTGTATPAAARTFRSSTSPSRPPPPPR
jgi:hypothetical protein